MNILQEKKYHPPPDQRTVTPQAKFSYSPLEKIQNQLKIKVKYKCKQLKSIKSN